VDEGATIMSSTDGHRFFFYVGGSVALNLVINATMSGFVLNYLELADKSFDSMEAKIIHRYARKQMRLEASLLIGQMNSDHANLIDSACTNISFVEAPTLNNLTDSTTSSSLKRQENFGSIFANASSSLQNQEESMEESQELQQQSGISMMTFVSSKKH
jgi:hypothetical protein